MSELRQLTSKRRRIDQQIVDAENHLDQVALGLEALRAEREKLAEQIRDEVMGLPIAQACTEMVDSILDAEVLV